jgi:nuclear transport factor 2 (NTF2) superfamily protein
MKSILVLTCCLALASIAAADKEKHKDKKNAGQQQGQQQQLQQQHAGKQGKQGKHGMGAGNDQQLRMGGGGGKNSQAMHANKTFNKTVNKKVVKNYNVKNVNINKYEKVTFKANAHIVGSDKWHGQKYVVFRNYKCEWHDHDWWIGHHNRIVVCFGAPYFFNAGYWYPAWGYDPGASYVYDGPVYAYNNLPPDQVIANVQSALQEQGYYQGEVDGVLGPLTRAALASYQEANGLYTTSAIDEPTLESLGFA